MTIKTSTLTVVHFTDLQHHGVMDQGFDKVSYGDAEYTLATPAQLIWELEDQALPEKYGRPSLTPLIEELKQVPDGVLVALNG